MNVIGYARVSTADQEENGHGLSAQETRIREACERRDWTLLEVIRESGSGKDLRRERLLGALQRVANGEAEGMVVAKLDRLSRSLIDFAMLLEWFRDNEAAFVALDFDIDTSTPGGELVANVLLSVAQWERRAIGQRTSDAMQDMKRRGLPVGPPAVGADARALIADMRKREFTIREIAAYLNATGVPTARGGSWSPSTVHAALGNRRRPPRRRIASLPTMKRRN